MHSSYVQQLWKQVLQMWLYQQQANGHFVEGMGVELHKVPDKPDFVDNFVVVAEPGVDG